MTPIEPQLENHLRIMIRRWWWIIGAAVATFTAVYLVQSASPDVFRARGVAQLRVPVELADDGDLTEFQARTYAESAASPVRLEAALAQTDLTIDVDEAEDLVSVALLSTPGFVEVTADGSSPEAAETLAAAVLSSMIAEVEADATTVTAGSSSDLLVATIVAPADASSSPVSPRPLTSAVLGGIIAAIVAAEAAVLVWFLQGRLSLADPVRQVTEITGARTIDLTGADPEPLVPFVMGQLEDRPVVTVLQSGKVPSAEVAVRLDRAMGRNDGRVLIFDTGSGRPEMRLSVEGDRLAAQLDRVDVPNSHNSMVLHHLLDVVGATTTLVSATTAVEADSAFETVREFPEAVILVIDPRKTTKRRLTRQVAALADVRASLIGVILHREPRRPVPLQVADSR